MSFFLTTRQMRQRTKGVTRRLGWDDLKPGERVCAVVKGQGIPKGGKIERICVIECTSNTKEPLNRITQEEVVLEGFPEMTTAEFVAMFCKANKCTPRKQVNRIAFDFVDEN